MSVTWWRPYRPLLFIMEYPPPPPPPPPTPTLSGCSLLIFILQCCLGLDSFLLSYLLSFFLVLWLFSSVGVAAITTGAPLLLLFLRVCECECACVCVCVCSDYKPTKPTPWQRVGVCVFCFYFCRFWFSGTSAFSGTTTTTTTTATTKRRKPNKNGTGTEEIDATRRPQAK